MPERLAIKTDKRGSWQRGDIESAARSLLPRDVDAGKKSAWAHCTHGDDNPGEEILADPQQATLKIQALTLLILSSRGGPNRSRVEGVSLDRDGLPFRVTEDEQPHLLVAYRTTHRSLETGNLAACAAAAEKVIKSGTFATWKFSRAELGLLLSNLLKLDVVAPEMRQEAKAALDLLAIH